MCVCVSVPVILIIQNAHFICFSFSYCVRIFENQLLTISKCCLYSLQGSLPISNFFWNITFQFVFVSSTHNSTRIKSEDNVTRWKRHKQCFSPRTSYLSGFIRLERQKDKTPCKDNALGSPSLSGDHKLT